MSGYYDRTDRDSDGLDFGINLGAGEKSMRLYVRLRVERAGAMDVCYGI